ncbi:MAG: MarR family transcriptional regulator [Ktedonobacterales bacterium]|nr:MarR family transcriptional regulator [Ktedonobacterales bacterium]
MADESEIATQIDAFLAGWFRMRQTVMEANFHRAHQHGLSTTQFLVLNLLSEQEEPWTLRRLATALNLEAATLVRTIDSLEGRSLVARERSTTDRRRVHITLTDGGRALQTASREHFRARLSAIFRQMDPTARRDLITGLAAFAAAAHEPREEETHG